MIDINKPTLKVPKLVKDENRGVPGSIAGKITDVEKYSKKDPTEMTKKFTAIEIQGIAKRLGNDKLAAQFIKKLH